MTASLGGLLGLLIAYSAIREGTPRWIRTGLTTFSGVAANFAGIPLAFAFVATLGALGVVTQFLRTSSAYNLYDHGFSLFSKTGIELVVPLLPDPADDPRHRTRDRRAPA